MKTATAATVDKQFAISAASALPRVRRSAARPELTATATPAPDKNPTICAFPSSFTSSSFYRIERDSPLF
jgi:hypothetical protein